MCGLVTDLSPKRLHSKVTINKTIYESVLPHPTGYVNALIYVKILPVFVFVMHMAGNLSWGQQVRCTTMMRCRDQMNSSDNFTRVQKSEWSIVCAMNKPNLMQAFSLPSSAICKIASKLLYIKNVHVLRIEKSGSRSCIYDQCMEDANNTAKPIGEFLLLICFNLMRQGHEISVHSGI
jgi:hypothetical protein